MRGVEFRIWIIMTAAVPAQSRKKPSPQPVRHRWFDPYLIPSGEVFQSVLLRITEDVLAFEKTEDGGGRRRQRRPKDQAHFETMIGAVVANLAYVGLNPPETGRLAINTRNGDGRTRYDHRAFGTTFRGVIGHLFLMDYLHWSNPRAIRGEVSSIAPGKRWAELTQGLVFTFDDFSRDQGQEVIMLNRKRRSATPWSTDAPGRERIDYKDTTETMALRTSMQALNAFLADANVTFEVDDAEPTVDPRDRLQRRYYVMKADQSDERFDQSGRLFGGFWSNMKASRRSRIRINGEPTKTLDYGSMFTRLAYAELGATPPESDLYAIDGLAGYRSGVKMAMNCFLFDEANTRRTWPAVLGQGVGDDHEAQANPDCLAASFQARLPAGWTVRKTKAAILAKHPALVAAWGRGLGYRLMNTESDILVEVLLDLMAKGIPALGLHDGLMVQSSFKDEARRVMEDVSLRKVGVVIPVGEKD